MMTLRTKTFLLLVAVALLAVTATGLFFLRQLEQSLRKTILHGADTLAERASTEVAGFLEDSLRDTEAIAKNLPAGAVERGDWLAIETYFGQMLAIYPKFENGLFILDAQGRSLVDMPAFPEHRGMDLSHRSYFRDTLSTGRGMIGDPYLSKRHEQPVLTFTMPLNDSAGKFQGVLGASVILTSPRALGGLAEDRYGQTGYFFIIDTSRTMILHPDATRILRQDVPVGANRLLDRALDGYEGAGETINSRGVKMLSSFRRVPGTRWILGAQQPVADAFAPVSAMLKNFIGLGLASAAAAALFGAWFLRRLTSPLVALRQTALELALPETSAQAFAAAGAMAGVQKVCLPGDEVCALNQAFSQLYQRLGTTLASVQSSAQDWERTFDAVQDVIFILDREQCIRRINRAAARLLQIEPAAAVGQPFYPLVHGTDQVPQDCPQQEAVSRGVNLTRERLIPAFNVVFEETTSPLFGEDGRPVGVVHIWRDLTERREAEEKIRRMAYSDHLTGLPNRASLKLRLGQMLAQASQTGDMVAVLFLDLDRFKQINDTLGHTAGDHFLQAIAGRLEGCLRRIDTVARQGGDEFVIILPGVLDAQSVARVADKLLAALAEPLVIHGRSLLSSGSLGIALYPEDGRDVDTLLKHADIAMYRAKEAGRNTWRGYQAAIKPAANDSPSARMGVTEY